MSILTIAIFDYYKICKNVRNYLKQFSKITLMKHEYLFPDNTRSPNNIVEDHEFE